MAAIILASLTPALAQDLQPKGVSYYGAQSARKLYTTPPATQQQLPQGARRRHRASGSTDANATAGGAITIDNASRSFTQTISSGGIPRQFIVHIPPSYSSSRPAPVILVFHGLSMSAQMMPPLTLMNAAADRYGYIVVYPDGYNHCWNDGIQPRAADDIRFVNDMLGALARQVNYDQRRVYACGLSNGGYFAQRLACEMPNRIAAIGVVAASGGSAICNSCGSTAVPVIYFLGTDDPLVPRDGVATKNLGKLGDALGLSDLGIDNISAVKDFAGLMSQQEAIDWWVKHNGASPNPSMTALPDRSPRDKCTVKREIYGAGRREVDAYIVENGGHTWPGGMPVASGTLGRTTLDINASELMCEFFRNH
jgi:polyhydroxybutyrate depolymerase